MNSRAARIVARRITPADVPAVLALQARSTEASQWSAEGYIRAAAGEYPAWVAGGGEGIHGFLVMRTAADESEILNLAVEPERRRQGIASALLAAAIEACRAAGAKSVYLEVRESNAVAIAFYRSSGFEPTGRRARYYQDPPEAAVVMSQALF